jgi:hypothetical protein
MSSEKRTVNSEVNWVENQRNSSIGAQNNQSDLRGDSFDGCRKGRGGNLVDRGLIVNIGSYHHKQKEVLLCVS